MKEHMIKQRRSLMVTDSKRNKESREDDALLLFVLEGEIRLTIEGSPQVLQKEKTAIVNSGQAWNYESSGSVLLAVVPILYEYISISACGFKVHFIRNPESQKLKKIVTKLIEVSEYNPGKKRIYAYDAAYYDMLQYLLDYCLDREVLELYEKGDTRRDSIVEYIHMNYSSQISLTELADHLYLSTGYLSRYFTKTFGTGFAQYLMKVRLRHVYDELIYTDKSITQISYDCGFTSISLFNRSFKRMYGVTPSELRAREAKKEEKSEQDSAGEDKIRSRVEAYFSTLNRPAEGEESFIRIDASQNEGTYDSRWKMLNVGSVANLRSSTLQNHVRLLHESGGFLYVRFWGLFSKDLFLGEADGLKMNFSRIDRIFDFILQTGMKPFIDLEEKPERINRDIHRSVHYAGTEVLFENKEAWERTFARLLTHLLERYTAEEMASWIIEVGQYRYYKSELGNEAFFFEMFENVFRTVRTAVPGMQVGGSIASEYFAVGERIEIFLNHWAHRSLKPDFLSLIIYGYDTDAQNLMKYKGISRDPDIICEQTEKFREMLVWAGFDADGFVLSEWNVSVSERNLLNDSAFRGAYMVRTVLSLMGKVLGMGIFMASDQIAEHYDSADFLFGGNGLVTKDGILKPAAFAYMFLNQLYPELISRDNRYIATTNGRNKYRILLHSLEMPNFRFYMGEEDKLDIRQFDSYFDREEAGERSVVLSGLPRGKYRLRTERVNSESGSVLQAWREFGFIKNIAYHDIEYLKRVIGPRMSLMEAETEGDVLRLDVKMDANEIVLISADFMG